MKSNSEKARFGFLITIGLATFVGFISLVVSMSMDKPATTLAVENGPIPSRFRIPNGFLTPATKEISDHPTWISSVLSFFESYYKKQGQSMGKFNSSYSPRFSETAFIIALRKACKNSNSDACRHFGTPLSIDSGSSSVIKSLILDHNISFVPESKCTVSTSYEDCEEALNVVSKKRLFEFKKSRFAQSVDGIKELLYSSQRPLLLSMPSVYAQYYIPCTDERVKNSESCTKLSITCPFNEAQSCSIVETSTFLKDGSHFIPQYQALPVLGEHQSYFVIGFADEYVPSEGINGMKTHKLTKGGFIVQSLLGKGVGHSLDYLYGRKSYMEEYQQCPNLLNPFNWNPLGEYSISETKLNCTNEKLCDPKKEYYLEMSKTNLNETLVMEDRYGLTETYMIEVDLELKKTESIIIDELPFWNLDESFNPSIMPIEQSSECGYWFLPYDLINLAIQMSSEASEGVIALDMPIKWSPEAF